MADIWTAQECADYLRVHVSTFRNEIRYRPGFPAPLPWSVVDFAGQPLKRPVAKWHRSEVEAWALRKEAA